jgi:hypothetical protein
MPQDQTTDPKYWFTVAASAPPSGRCATFFQWLLRKDAPERFAHLLTSPVAVERVYGLLGLWLTDPTAFSKALPRLERDGSPVTELVGDVKTTRSVSELARRIKKGEHYDPLIRDRLGKPLTIFPRYGKS